MKHPKYAAKIDGEHTKTCILVPIARLSGDKKTICVLQLRNKCPKNVKTKKGDASNTSCFRTDDINFLQYFALNSSTLFEEALDLQKAKETDEQTDSDKEKLKEQLIQHYQNYQDNALENLSVAIEQYHRKALTEKYAQLIKRLS